jgi:serine/threonine-protein kinase
VVVDSFPVDASVYGVRGLGGNAQDWCADVFDRDGPLVDAGRVVVPTPGEAPGGRSFRGGSCIGSLASPRSANRRREEARSRNVNLGFRLVASA